VSVTGMTTNGSVIASINAGTVVDLAGNPNTVSTSTDNSVTWIAPDVTPPTVTINKAAGQSDPTSVSPIVFDVVFSETVTGFVSADISMVGSTAGGTLVPVVAGSGGTYTITVTGMTTAGNVVVNFSAGAASDLASNPSVAPTIIDNTVAWTVASGGTEGKLDFTLPANSGLQTIVLLEDI
jgi:hypothetical protein